MTRSSDPGWRTLEAKIIAWDERIRSREKEIQALDERLRDLEVKLGALKRRLALGTGVIVPIREPSAEPDERAALAPAR